MSLLNYSTVITSDTKGTQYGPRRSGILETVQAIPTTLTPTVRATARENTGSNSTDNLENRHSVKTNVLKTNFSYPVNENAAISNEPGSQNTANGPQNLATYSFDPPNSFPQPTSIPAIDTFSATWPTPMGSIDNEMNDIENPPTLPPIGNEMSSVEKIPGIAQITSVQRIPLNFEEDEPSERSHATFGNFMPGHASPGHASAGHANHTDNSSSIKEDKVPLNISRNTINAHARRRENVAVKPRDFSDLQSLYSVKLISNKFKRREKTKSKDKRNLRLKMQQRTHHYSYSFRNNNLSKKRVFIPPPKPIGPIQPLLEKFQKEKEVGDIKEHTLDFEKIKPHEAIDNHLISIKTQPKIEPIEKHLSKEELGPIEPIENHQLAMNVKK